MRVSVFDYGSGNLHSLRRALQAHGAEVRIDTDPAVALQGDALVLPGVGAFGAAAKRLEAAREEIVAALEGGFPCLGICLGMQLLFSASEESPGRGLGFIDGQVRRLRARRAPQMGWNDVELERSPNGPDPLFARTDRPVVYYANTFVPDAESVDAVIAWTTYENDRFAAAVRKHNVWGVQFHPEKSAAVGLQIVGNFLQEAAS